MKVNRLPFPQNSILFPRSEKYDYFDSFGVNVNDENNRLRLTDTLKIFSGPVPTEIKWLFNLRDKIASFFGLKTARDIKNTRQQNFPELKPGDQIGIFRFFEKSENEIILGEDDKHLNFRVSLILNAAGSRKKEIVITTVVEFNNRFGRIYFFIIKPFHRIIVPVFLKRKIKSL